jgi:predicted DNA-binding transcriptional regulator YafY
MGISCERKSIYRDIAALNDFGYEVIATRTPRQGFFLASRALEIPEVRLLLDAVAAASFITEKKTQELSAKLCTFLSESQQETVLSQLQREGAFRRVKMNNEELYYTVDTIHRAIAEGRRISFTYHHKILEGEEVQLDAGRSFVVSPYALVWNDDQYYLVANYDKYDDLTNYRIDRMKHVTVTEEPARPIAEVSGEGDSFDSAAYLKMSFFMYGSSSVETVTFSCDASLLEPMVDKFGTLEDIRRGDGRFTFSAKVQCSEGFYHWVLGWGGRVVVEGPPSVREVIGKKIRTLSDSYGV